MIKAGNNLFELHTNSTSYIMYVNEAGYLMNLHYGRKVSSPDINALMPKVTNQNGCSVIADLIMPNLSLDDAMMECPTRGKGDYSESMVDVTFSNGSATLDLRYESFYLSNEKMSPANLPGAYFENQKEDDLPVSLEITLKDKHKDLKVKLVYSVFEASDCITRFVRVVNDTDEDVYLEKALSLSVDMPLSQMKVTNFVGDWTREMNRNDTIISGGTFVNESRTGFSSNHANPFVMYGDVNATETSGKVIATNLIYSGNHRESVSVSSHGKTRITTGINPYSFGWNIKSGDSFESPEAVLTFSDIGYDGISKHMHSFVRNNIVRGPWKFKERPVLLNSWEACYFDVKESRILKLAKAAKDVGVELFVLDDGWFGKRNNDTSSLGDWFDNKDKLPGGIQGLSKKIKEMGLMFGIWVEPEMINEDSNLYRTHPDWAIKIPNRDHSLGRNQCVLDLTRNDVQDYLIETLSDVFTRGNVDYVKWDMNRNISDAYSMKLNANEQKEFYHRYICGLYRVLKTLQESFPNILFEACASGGNRSDLGMLCFMQQVWGSDCTDAYQRSIIQTGYSYGYPQSVIGAHVSSCPNHQTLRNTPLKSRFAVSFAGLLGIELNLCDAAKEDLEKIKEQIAVYKEWRKTLQFGQMIRLTKENKSRFDTEAVEWLIVSEDKSEAVGLVLQGLAMPNHSARVFTTRDLNPEYIYHFYNIQERIDVKRMGDLINTASPIHIKQDSLVHDVVAKFYKMSGEKEDYTVSGELLNNAGIRLSQTFVGTGMGENTGLFTDFDSRVYFLKKV